MVTKRLRSEYMKKFKDPKWETYSKCYDELLRYRLKRRLLEQSHNPWFWSGTESDSDSAGENLSQVKSGQAKCAERAKDLPRAPLEECQGAQIEVPRLSVLEKEHCGCHHQGERDSNGPKDERAEETGSKHKSVVHRGQQTAQPENDPAAPQTQQKKLPSRSKLTRSRPQRIKSAPARPPTEDDKHPFALYACGEKDADIAGRKTHNVRPLASTSQIHASALRAKSRREAERLAQSPRSDRRRASSPDADQHRIVVQPAFNPWLTEYMRCFSARSR
ncbi:centriole, cilia and spindle-associated protein isoform X2 [Corythoichthys intestinalis]|uniref:centriole, cilia and spindle-associated protein isoform X2 n=1 Tax=Corythoichthys intestinalis TaxID=161448 RepID=UPI0025A5A0EA|nr:centriole, cilia and spindle-associated protein isoform X2 [Corythoichthys intestinalis]